APDLVQERLARHDIAGVASHAEEYFHRVRFDTRRLPARSDRVEPLLNQPTADLQIPVHRRELVRRLRCFRIGAYGLERKAEVARRLKAFARPLLQTTLNNTLNCR